LSGLLLGRRLGRVSYVVVASAGEDLLAAVGEQLELRGQLDEFLLLIWRES
jgi:hypothetical protein